MGQFRLRLVVRTVLISLIGFAVIAMPAAGAHSDPALIAALDEDGRYIEVSSAGLDGSIDNANANGVAFAWLDQGGDSAVAVSLADDYVEDLAEINSRYLTVVVLTSEGVAASSDVYGQAELDNALDASFESFRVGSAGRGLEIFTDTLAGSLAGNTTGTTIGGANGSNSGSDSNGGIGFGTILVVLAAIGGAFLAIRGFLGGRKRKRQAGLDMEADRAEIKEQLKNNADRVITLGDRVIAKGDQELIVSYEEASATYQEVSQQVDEASTPEAVDALDDRIDHAEWQFEVIEAQLDGLPVPRSPAERTAAAAAAAAAADQAAAARNTPPPPSEPRVATSPRTGRQYPRTSRTAARRGNSRGGGLGGALGSILGSVVLGGGLGGGTQSRRTQRRSGGLGGVLGGGIGSSASRSPSRSRSGGLGGGVLRRGGSSNPRARSSSAGRNRSTRSRSRGGRSF